VPRVHDSALIDGVRLAELDVFADARGRFLETWRAEWFPGADPMIQGNRSDSAAGVLRGLHYHLRQADYWQLIAGEVFVGLYDLRRASPTRGARETFSLTVERGLYIPRGVAHGFYAVVDATLTYLVDRTYDGGADELGLAWNDPDAAIPWPVATPVLSARDLKNPALRAIPDDRLPA
jgi:dTDP-4-dehydrorhamnose 3,5-epimerase